MTIVLKPSEIEQGLYLHANHADSLCESLRVVASREIDQLLVFGNTYSLGGDLDILLFFDELRSNVDVLQGMQSVRDLCRLFRCQHYDMMTLWRVAEGDVKGIDDIRGVGPLLHLLDTLDKNADDSVHLKMVLEKALEQRGGRTEAALVKDVRDYANHKVVSLAEHASHKIDVESQNCTTGLGKILSFPAHMLRKLWRLEHATEPESREALQKWAKQKADGNGWFAVATEMMEVERSYRAVLANTVDKKGDAEVLQAYRVFLEQTYQDTGLKVIQLAKSVECR